MLIRHTILYLPAQLLGPLILFGTVAAWTHWLPPVDYGVVALIVAAQDLIFLGTIFWWTHYTLRYMGNFNTIEEQSRLHSTELFVFVCSALLQTAAAILTVVLMNAAFTVGFMAAAIIFIVTRSMLTHLGDRARAAGQIFPYTIAKVGSAVLGLGLSYFGVHLIEATATMVLGGLALAQIVSLSILWVQLGMGRSAGLAQIDPAILRSAASYGLPLLVSGVIGWVGINGLRPLIDWVAGAKAVGLLAVGWGLGQSLVSVVALTVTTAAYPLAVKHMNAGVPERALDQLALNGAILWGALAPTLVGAVILTKPLVALTIGAQYQEMTLVVLPLALAAATIRNMRAHFADQIFMLLAQPRPLLVVNVAEALATLVFAYYGFRIGGLPGACAGCLAANALGLMLSIALGTVKLALRLPTSAGLRIAVAALAMGYIVSVIDPDASVWSLLIAIFSGSMAYPTVLMILFWRELNSLKHSYRTTAVTNADQCSLLGSLSGQPPNPFVRVEVHHGLEGVTSQWRELEKAGTASPHQRLAWFKAWIQTAGTARGEAPLIVTATDKQARTTLLLPLVVRSRFGLTVASFAGGRHANFNTPLLRSGLALDAGQVERLFSEISRLRPDLDLLVLEAMPPAWEGVDNPLVGSSARPHSASGSLLSSTEPGRAFDIPARRRKERWRDRQMLQHGAVAVQRAASPVEATRALMVFAAQKADWFKTRGIEDPFQVPGVLDFFNALAIEPTSGFELYCLTVGDTVAAVAGIILGRSRVSLMFVSYDAASPVAAYSPGIRLIQEVMAVTRQRGFAEFDFGLGEASYKARFGARLEPSVVLTRALTPRGRLGALVVESQRRAKIAAKRRPWLAGFLTRLQSRMPAFPGSKAPACR